jgi:tRNA A37 threonylcarbamoyladenosine synthetase subunit TsaC/SUA5/YrdC
MFLHIHEDNPQPRLIYKAIEILRNGGVVIYPTDTIYGLGCDIFQQKAIEKVCWLKNIQPSRAKLSFICNDLSNLSEYAASKQVPKILKTNKDTIGLRIPNNNITRAIVREMGNPILSTSLPGETAEEFTDPDMIYRNFENKVDLVIDGGIGGLIPSTVIDCTGAEPVLLRQGLGEWIN